MPSPLSLTLIQSNLHWEDKRANLEMFEEKINSIKVHTEIVVLPEMFSTGFSMKAAELAEPMDGKTIQWMRRIAHSKKIILTGSVIIEEEGFFYNRLIWMLPDGQIGCYNKRHLFAYAGEDRYYTPGSKRLIAAVNGWKINLMICYDLRFPVWNRLTSNNGETIPDEAQFEYDLMIFVANWPDRRRHAWLTLLQARAIENQCYVAGVNRVGKDGLDNYYTGDSMVADPLGEILFHNKDQEDIHTITIDKSVVESIRKKLPFWKDADSFKILNTDQ
jgi:predicted amidohydrolase